MFGSVGGYEGLYGTVMPLTVESVVGLSSAANRLSLIKAWRALVLPVDNEPNCRTIPLFALIPLVPEVNGSPPVSVAASCRLVALVEIELVPASTYGVVALVLFWLMMPPKKPVSVCVVCVPLPTAGSVVAVAAWLN